jgi:hypothetical protein
MRNSIDGEADDSMRWLTAPNYYWSIDFRWYAGDDDTLSYLMRFEVWWLILGDCTSRFSHHFTAFSLYAYLATAYGYQPLLDTPPLSRAAPAANAPAYSLYFGKIHHAAYHHASLFAVRFISAARYQRYTAARWKWAWAMIDVAAMIHIIIGVKIEMMWCADDYTILMIWCDYK